MRRTALVPLAAIAALALPAGAQAKPTDLPLAGGGTVRAVDQDHDRRLDLLLWDAQGDGRFDAGAIDADRDGRFEHRWTDADADGLAQRDEVTKAAPTRACRTERRVLRCALRTPRRVFGKQAGPQRGNPVGQAQGQGQAAPAKPAPQQTPPPPAPQGPEPKETAPAPMYDTAPAKDAPAMPQPPQAPVQETLPTSYDTLMEADVDCNERKERIIGANVLHPKRSMAVDTNGDGRPDVIVVGTAYGPVVDVLNMDNDPCDEEIVVLSNLNTTTEVLDLDGDGDFDLVILGSDKGGLYRGSEQGDGDAKEREVVISHDDLPADYKQAVDLDGDGDIDVTHVGRR